MSCRQAREIIETTINALLFINDGHLSGSQRLEKTSRGVEIELWIFRLDAEKEAVPARQREPRHVEDRVIGHWQAVERQHAEHRRQRCAEDRALEGDGDER